MGRLTEIRQRTEAATPGPWMVQNGSDVFTEIGADNGNGAYAAQNDAWQVADCDPASGEEYCIDVDADGAIKYGPLKSKSNAAFIANAREDIPYLLSEVGRLNALHKREIIVTGEYAQRVIDLTARAEAAEAERDTLMKHGRCCITCGKEKCRMAGGGINVHGCGSWEWRGQQAGKGDSNG